MSDFQNFMRTVGTPTVAEMSVAGEELVKKLLPNDEGRHFKVLSFRPKSACMLIVNKGTKEEEKIPVDPDLGYNRDERFRYIKTLEIQEAGIEYYFLAGY